MGAVRIWQLICSLSWVSGISRTLNFGGLRLVFSGLSSLLLRSVTFFPFFIKGRIPFPVVRVEVSGEGSCLCVI